MRVSAHMKRHAALRFVAAIALAAISINSPAADEAAKPVFAVSARALGVAGGEMEASALAATMNNGGWCNASVAPASAGWNKRPDSIPASQWVSVVVVGFGERAEAFAFMFDQPDGTARLVGHVTYGMSWTPAVPKVWIPPVGRLVSAIRDGYKKSVAAENRRPVSINIAEWGSSALESDASLMEPSDDLDGMSMPKAAATVTLDQALPPIEAMLYAALCENGMSPAAGAAMQLSLEIRLGFRAAALRLVLQAGGEKTLAVKEEVPEEAYYRHIRRMLRGLDAKQGGTISDFVFLGLNPLQFVAATSNALDASSGGLMTGYDSHTGKPIWPLPKKDAPASYQLKNGIVFRYSGDLAIVDLEKGSESRAAPEAPGYPWSFDAAADGTIVVARGSAISAYQGGVAAWKKTEGSDIGAGPVISGDAVFAGVADGEIVCRKLSDGSQKWRKALPGEPRGGMLCAEGKLFVFSKGQDVLVAMNAADGAKVWERALGDVLFKAPVLVGGNLLVIGKNNKMLLLGVADGKVLGEVQWPTWLIDVIEIGGSKPAIACTDIEGKLSYLDKGNLKTISQYALPARPAGNMVFVDMFPVKWAVAASAEEDMEMLYSSDMKPVVLVGDVEGICNILPVK